MLTFLGIYNCRKNTAGGSLSVHGEGRAIDCGANANTAAGRAAGDALAHWCATHAEAAGVQQIIWNRKVWNSTKPYWHTYTGPNPHTDHVHVELCWWSARNMTIEKFKAISGGPFTPPSEVDMPRETDIVAQVAFPEANGKVLMRFRGDIVGEGGMRNYGDVGSVWTQIKDPKPKREFYMLYKVGESTYEMRNVEGWWLRAGPGGVTWQGK